MNRGPVMHLVLIPGFMTDASLWDDVLPDFHRLGTVTHGNVSRAESISEMGQQVLLTAPERFVLIGFSRGGYVARDVARRAPNRVQALVLIASSARADTPGQARQKALAVRTVDPHRFTGLSQSAVRSSLHPDRASDTAMIERVRVMSKRVGGAVFVQQAAQTRESDLNQLAAIQCPTLVIAAEEDGLRSLDEARELQAGISGATLTLIEGSGHMIPIEQPAQLTAAVVPWLRGRAVPTNRTL